MAQIKHRANLSGKSFPLLADWQAQTVVIPQSDSPYSRYGTPGERIRDVEVAGPAYMHNVLPTIEGYKSVGINVVATNAAIAGTGATALKIALLQNLGITYPIVELSDGTFYRLDTTLYTAIGLAGGNVVGGVVSSPQTTTYAAVGGTTYAYMYGAGPGKFSQFDGINFNNVVPAGLSLVTTKGICASNGYVIAWSDTAIAWSAETSPTDFVPSTITGAGGGAIQEIKGKILFCSPTNFGFIIYCTANCVSATYTGNSRFPFNFREIKGAGGGLSLNLVAEAATYNYQYAVTTKGIQLLYSNYAETEHSFVTDWILKWTAEYFDVTNLNFITKTQTGIFGTDFPQYFGKLTLVASRYLVYSFNTTNSGTTIGLYNYALVYDLELERWGLLKVTHNDCFTFDTINSAGSYTPSSAFLGALFGFMTPAGVISKSIYEYSSDSVLILGKFQYIRNRRLALDEVVIDLVYNIAGLNVVPGNLYAIPILSGQIIGTAVPGTLVAETAAGKSKKYNFLLDAESFFLVITGSFNLNTVAITAHLGGKF